MTPEQKRINTKQKLNEVLPKGFVKSIKDYLELKGITVSIGKISQVCNINLSDWDIDVIEAGFEVARLEEEREEELHIKVKSL